MSTDLEDRKQNSEWQLMDCIREGWKLNANQKQAGCASEPQKRPGIGGTSYVRRRGGVEPKTGRAVESTVCLQSTQTSQPR